MSEPFLKNYSESVQIHLAMLNVNRGGSVASVRQFLCCVISPPSPAYRKRLRS
ncbi:MAG: hypothetical protein MJZ78_08120 [Bacteroidales bacterium]|nr:hypothetical protein [Bacteroidales bacterium]